MSCSLGNSNSYTILNATQLVATSTKHATDTLLLVDLQTSKAVELSLGLVDIPLNSIRKISNTKFVVLGSKSTSPSSLYVVDITKPSEKVLLDRKSVV